MSVEPSWYCLDVYTATELAIVKFIYDYATGLCECMLALVSVMFHQFISRKILNDIQRTVSTPSVWSFSVQQQVYGVKHTVYVP